MRKRVSDHTAVPMGQRIKELRLARNLTQEQLARLMDEGVDAVRKWERGKRTPMLDMAAKLADALECTIDELAGQGEPPAKKEKKK